MGLGLAACAACAGMGHKSEDPSAPESFYTVTGEIALARHQPRIAALQYAAAAANETDVGLLQRATQVAAETLQPSLAERTAERWIEADPKSVEAQRAAAQAALALYKIDQATAHYLIVLHSSPIGANREFAALEAYLAGEGDVFGARQLADRLVSSFPTSAAALRVQGFAALRADDPAAAVRSFTAVLAMPSAGEPQSGQDARNELQQTLARAQIMAGDAEGPLRQAEDLTRREASSAHRLDFALLLMTAQRDSAATQQLETLTQDPEYAPVAERLLGLIEFQEGHLEAANARFTELLRANKYLDDAFYYLGVIAERRGDPEMALRLYSEVQEGENEVPALLRAAALLQTHGAAQAAEELLDRLIEDEPQRAPAIITARARMYADTGDLPRAAGVLERGIQEYPDDVDLRYAMASTYEEQGRVREALHELTELLHARPDDPAALNALGYTLADHSRDLRRARELIERAYAAAPKNAAILDSLGWVLFREGHNVEAQGYLRAAYLDDRGGDIAAHLGEVLWQAGNPADAERIWSDAAAVDGDNRLLKATRQRLHAAPSSPPAPRGPSGPPAQHMTPATPATPATPDSPAAPASPATPVSPASPPTRQTLPVVAN